MALLERLRRAFRSLVRRDSDEPRNTEQNGHQAPPAVAGGAFGLAGIPGEESLTSMRSDELTAWENRDIPSIGRTSDASEARADEKQDATTSLNFPLHWTTAKES